MLPSLFALSRHRPLGLCCHLSRAVHVASRVARSHRHVMCSLSTHYRTRTCDCITSLHHSFCTIRCHCPNSPRLPACCLIRSLCAAAFTCPSYRSSPLMRSHTCHNTLHYMHNSAYQARCRSLREPSSLLLRRISSLFSSSTAWFHHQSFRIALRRKNFVMPCFAVLSRRSSFLWACRACCASSSRACT